MSLTFKKSTPKNYNNLDILIEDTTPLSNNYFRVSDVPSVLCKGKNLLRISAHPSHFLPDSQIIVDIKDANGEPIYFEIPEYLEGDKSRIISIWIYHDKDDYNTANGEAVISLYGIAKRDVSPGRNNAIPAKYEGKYNLKWSTTVNVDRNRNNISPVIFNSTLLPTTTLSESIDVYKNSPTDGTELEFTPITGNGANYLFRGKTPIIKTTDGQFLPEMVGNNIFLDTFTEPALPISKYDNPLNITSYTSSIKSIIDTNTVILDTPFTTTFTDQDELIHTFNQIDSANYSVSYFQEESRTNTENQRSFANVTFSGLEPITGVVDKIKVLIKSDGLPGEFELLNEVTVPFSSSVAIKVPIPSEHLKDPKILKFQYLNSIGEISRTQTKLRPFTFEGGNSYIGGDKNLISGSMFISNALGTGIEMGGLSSGFIRSVGFDGQTSASLGKGPGGFIIYSGSGNMLIGEDVLHGVGMQMIGDDDDRHFIFTTDDGGNLDIKTDKFFIGTTTSQFISGSDSNIEISSSLFHLDPKNNSLVIGAGTVINAALSANEIFTPATIGGVQSTRLNASASIDSGGFARFVSASIGGFEVSTTQINSANNNLILKSNGQITASSANITGDIVTDNITATGGTIGGFSINTATISSSNNNLILKDSGQITGSTVLFSGGTIGGFELTSTQINSANNNLILKDSGQITGSTVLFSGGKVAGFEISNSQINSTNDNLILKASGQITASDGFLFGDKASSQYVQYDDGNLVVRGDLSVDQIFTPATIAGSPANITNASSSITSTGFAKFTSASIGGWDITTGSIEGGNLLMKPEGILQTKDFASGVKGWKISSEANGTAEFENVRIRGTMRTTTFEKESVNAVGGQLWIANSSTLTGSILATAATMSVKNIKGFVSGEILLAKKVDNTGFQTEYILVNSSSIDGDQSNEDENYGRLYVTRGYGSGSSGDYVGDIGSISQSYEDGQVVVSTGKIGTGYIKLNANPSDQATPFMDIVERTGSGLYDVALAARLGDLSGLANSDFVFGSSAPGYGLATNNVYLQGGIKATFGDIGGFGISTNTLSSSNDNLILRDNGQITGSSVLFTAGRIASFLITSSRFDALRLVEEFTPINGTTATFSSTIPSEVDNRATVSITSLPTSSIIGVASRTDNTTLALDAGAYGVDTSYQINYTGSATFDSGKATFVSQSFTITDQSASFGAITGGFYASYESSFNELIFNQPAAWEGEYNGLYAFYINAAKDDNLGEGPTPFSYQPDVDQAVFPQYLYSVPNGDNKINFWGTRFGNADLELHIKPDLSLISPLTASIAAVINIVSSSNLNSESTGFLESAFVSGSGADPNVYYFTMTSDVTGSYAEYKTTGAPAVGFLGNINTNSPETTFINAYWTGSRTQAAVPNIKSSSAADPGAVASLIGEINLDDPVAPGITGSFTFNTDTHTGTGEIVGGFGTVINTTQPEIDFIDTFLTASGTGYGPVYLYIGSASKYIRNSSITQTLLFFTGSIAEENYINGNIWISKDFGTPAQTVTDYIYINSSSFEESINAPKSRVTHNFFLTASFTGSTAGAQIWPIAGTEPTYDISFNAPTRNAGNALIPAAITTGQYNTISSSFFVYIPDVAEDLGFRGEIDMNSWMELIAGGAYTEITSHPIAPLVGVGEMPVTFEVGGGGTAPTGSLNYINGDYFAAALAPGWILNPAVETILDSIDRNTGTDLPVGGTYNNKTWAEIAISGSGTYYSSSISPATSPMYGVPLTLTNNKPTQFNTLTTEVSLQESIWPLDIAESGSFQPTGSDAFDYFNNDIIKVIGRAVNITSRLDNTRVATDLSLSEFGALTASGGAYTASLIAQGQFGARGHTTGYEEPLIFTELGSTVSVGSLSGSFVEKVTFRISGSGEISSSNFFLDDTGNITGSKVNFTGGVISGSALNINANKFRFSNENGTISGDSNNFIISSSLLSLDNNSLEVKGDIRASSGFIQDTYLGGKIVETGIINQTAPGVRYQLPFLEAWASDSTDAKFTSAGYASTNTLIGSHGNWIVGGPIATQTQYLVTGSSHDGVGYPAEFKSWYDISGVGNDYKYISSENFLNVADASASLSTDIVGTQLVFNKAGAIKTGSAITSTITSELINISESLNNNYKNTHLQFAARGTTHPYPQGFVGFFPQFKVDIVSGSTTFFTKTYKDENATENNWVVFDIPITDILQIDATSTTDKTIEEVFKVKLSMNYSGSSSTGTLPAGASGLGFALTEMRLVEPVRIASIDTQTIHFKDTYLTWDGKETTAHKGNFAPIITSSTFEAVSGSNYTLGKPDQRWKTAYLKDAVSTLSDKRLKSNIEISDLGLSFIDSLKPVKYNMSDDKTHYGLIAQEVSQSLAEFDVHNFGGYDTDGNYLSLRYSEFISPLIKAVQEQSNIIHKLQTRIETLESGSGN